MAARKSTRHHHGRLREAAVRCSLDVVREQGLEALTLRAVADRAGVTHPALYRHFPDKTALLEVIAEDGFMTLHARIQRALARAGSDSEARLRALCRAFVRWALEAPEHFEVAVSRTEHPGPRSEDYLSEPPGDHEICRCSGCRDFLLLVVEVHRGQQIGEIGPGRSWEIASVIWSFVLGFVQLRIKGRGVCHRASVAGVLASLDRQLNHVLAGVCGD